MPQTPRCCVLTHTDLYTIAPLTLIKPYFASPLSYFLDEGLVCYGILIETSGLSF